MLGVRDFDPWPPICRPCSRVVKGVAPGVFGLRKAEWVAFEILGQATFFRPPPKKSGAPFGFLATKKLLVRSAGNEKWNEPDKNHPRFGFLGNPSGPFPKTAGTHMKTWFQKPWFFIAGLEALFWINFLCKNRAT